MLALLLTLDAGLAERGIDLLRRIELSRDTYFGAARPEAGSLILEPKSRLQVPWTAPAEFDLLVVAERLTDQGKLVVGLGAFDVVIDNWHANEHRAGPHFLDGRHVTEYPARVGAVFRNGARHRILYRVRADSLIVRVDGEEIVRHEGDRRRMSIDKRYAPPVKGAFYLANELSAWRVHRISLRPAGEERGTSTARFPLDQDRWSCGDCGRVRVAVGAAPNCHGKAMEKR